MRRFEGGVLREEAIRDEFGRWDPIVTQYDENGYPKTTTGNIRYGRTTKVSASQLRGGIGARAQGVQAGTGTPRIEDIKHQTKYVYRDRLGDLLAEVLDDEATVVNDHENTQRTTWFLRRGKPAVEMFTAQEQKPIYVPGRMFWSPVTVHDAIHNVDFEEL